MQGNLNEIDIRSILQLVELGQRTGELFVETYSSGHRMILGPRTIHREISGRSSSTASWFVFVSNGQIVYAADPNVKLSRLRDYLRRYNLENTLDSTTTMSISSTNALEYGYLWALLESQIITPSQGRSIVQGMIRETLFDLLSLHQGSFIFEIGSALAPQLVSLEISPLLTKMIKQVQEWNQFYPHIQSPNQCPVISDALQLRQALPENTFKSLSRWADGTTTLRQMSRYLNRDILTVARAIYPFVQLGLVQLFYPELPTDDSALNSPIFSSNSPLQIPRVVCIDDDVTIGKTVEYILQQHGYEVTAIVNPLKALSLVFQLKPDLILCDITMPEIDGYEICAMLRQSTAFRLTPMIMLTGLDGFINRIKARMIGANDYLTKPFGESELLMLIEKYIGSGDPDRPEPELLLSDGFDTQV
jgi:twitching motility two-component system response regulator PilG